MRLIPRVAVVLGLLFAPAASAQTAGKGGSGGTAVPPAAAAPAPAPAPAAPAAAPAKPTPPPPAAPAPAAPAPAAAPAPTPPAPAAAPAAPAPLAPTTTPGGGGAANKGVDLGISPTTPAITGGGTSISSKQAESLTATTSGGADEWKFDFHGYLSAPVHISFGPPSPVNPPSTFNPSTMVPPGFTADPRPAGSFVSPYPFGAPGLPGTQWHSPTRVPGYLYTTWEFTNTVHGPWTQLNFTYGNSRAMATVIVDSYSQTDGGYKHLQAQQGIDQAFLTLNFPDALGELGTLTWNIGTFQNRYGTMGKYDGGMYETYIFGRTHITGETLTANLTNIDSAGDWAISFEDGFGAKYDLVPYLDNPYYRVLSNYPVGYNNGKPYLSDRDAEYLPYAGPVPMGSTFVHHAHVGAKYQKLWTFGAHYLYTWTPDDNWNPINSRQDTVSNFVPRSLGPIQGSMAIAGVEARLNGGVYGDGYAAWSHIDARNINALADSIEVMHSYGGYQFKQNFFGQTYNAHTGVYRGPQNETGTIDNLAFQYSFSFGQLARYPEDFWGDGPDLVVTLFGILSIVNSPPPPIAVALDGAGTGNTKVDWNMSTKKLKWGIDAIYTPLYWLGVNGRWDYVQPDIDAAYAHQGNPGGSDLNFGVITGRLVFKTQFVTHETVQLVYQHYLLSNASYPAYPFQWVARADSNLVGLYASMWW